MSETARYFELPADVGLEPAFLRKENGEEVPNPKAGDPGQLLEVGITVPVPASVDGDNVLIEHRRVAIKASEQLDKELLSRIVPGTRIVETKAPAVCEVLSQIYVEVDRPKRSAASAGKE